MATNRGYGKPKQVSYIAVLFLLKKAAPISVSSPTELFWQVIATVGAEDEFSDIFYHIIS